MKTPEEIKEKMQAVRDNLSKGQTKYFFSNRLTEFQASDMVVKFFDKFLEWIDEDDGGEQE